MDKISVLDKTFVPFIGHDELMGCIDSVAERINKDFEGATDVPIVLCILNDVHRRADAAAELSMPAGFDKDDLIRRHINDG